MKRNAANFFAIFMIAVILSGCATVFGGRVTECQKTRPVKGEAKRAVRAAPLIFNIILGGGVLGLLIDFSTGAIYKPCETKVNVKPADNKNNNNNNNNNKPPGMNK